MSRADVAAAILWTGATLYALFGGADFGGGAWDLLAGFDERKGERPRARIQQSLTPVWEANHVWLIFILVVLWTAFPEAFGAIMTTLYVPITLAALGIVLRGAGFAFRKSIHRLSYRRAMGATFALSSVLTPFFMGTVVGAIAAGNVPADGNGDAFSSWTGPLPLLTGALFVLASAYLAAIFLLADSHRADDREMESYFSRRALIAGLIAGTMALFGLIALHAEAHYVYERLIVEGLPLVIASILCGFGVLGLLLARGRRGLRPLAAGAVIAVIWGWGVAQFPYLLPTSLRIDQAAAPGPTLDSVLVVFVIAAVVVLPALGLLYWLSQRELLGE
ncbi:MAG TPA: cytochrome d ubiquinol oxidase subunit II [Solirubrobacterales bacterium]|nr:cytochrome d ubiquinol oxidase subunit II [Solirubrobacterales bacterium]